MSGSFKDAIFFFAGIPLLGKAVHSLAKRGIISFILRVDVVVSDSPTIDDPTFGMFGMTAVFVVSVLVCCFFSVYSGL